MPVLTLLAAGCVEDTTFQLMEPQGRQFPVRNRVQEVMATVPPESLRVREARAFQELLDRYPSQEARDEIRMVLDRQSTSAVVSAPDSIAAELISLIYSLRIAEEMRQKGEEEFPTPYVEPGEP